MTTFIKTTTVSIYEQDASNRLFRRLEGEGSPLPRVGEDGVWKPYKHCEGPVVGYPFLIVWDVEDTKNEPLYRSTLTSVVREIHVGGYQAA